MIGKLISSVLNHFLGNFIEDLDSKQLDVSLWSGKISLDNLQIKKSLFDTMPVPFELHHGKVGKIYLEIPITSLTSSPLKIEISDVFLFIKPKHL